MNFFDKSNVQIQFDSTKRSYYCRLMHNGKRKFFSSSHPTRKKAEQEIFSKIDAWLNQEENISNNISFKEAWDLFLQEKNKFIRPTSLNSVKYKWHHLAHLANMPLSKIKKKDYQQIIYNAYLEQNLSYATLKNLTNLIIDFSKFCAIKSFIQDHDVPLFFDIPKQAKKGEKIILTPKELEILFDEQYDELWYIPVYRFIVLTGLRRGELCALQKHRDFDNKNFTVSINESLSHEGYITQGKTKQAQRKIILSNPATKELVRHLENQKAKGILGSPYLFCSSTGNRINPKVLLAEWSKWKVSVGIKCTLHELRHTFASYSMQRTDIDLDTFKKIFGHSKTMDTYQTYVHELTLTESEKKEELEKMRVLSENISASILKYTKSAE